MVCRMLDDGGKPYGNKNWTLIGEYIAYAHTQLHNKCFFVGYIHVYT